jgi:hypothetical protein
VTDGRLAATLAAIGRTRRWKPRTYKQAWLFAWFGAPLGYVIVFCIVSAFRRWHVPWSTFALIYMASLVSQGLAWSYDLHRRGKRARHMPMES